MQLLVLKSKRKTKIFFCKNERALNKKLALHWRVRATAQVLTVAQIKKIRAIAVKGLWHTKI